MRIPDRWLFAKALLWKGPTGSLLRRVRMKVFAWVLAPSLIGFCIIALSAHSTHSRPGTLHPAWMDDASDIWVAGLVIFGVWFYGAIMGPMVVFLLKLGRAGWRIKDHAELAALALIVHGMALYFWRIPKAESLAAVPLDPDRYGWTFLRTLHQYQYRLRGEAFDSSHPSLAPGRRGRAGAISYWGSLAVAFACFAALLAWHITESLAGA